MAQKCREKYHKIGKKTWIEGRLLTDCTKATRDRIRRERDRKGEDVIFEIISG